MRRSLFLYFLALLTASGCATSLRPVAPNESLSAVNAQLAGREALVLFKDGRRARVRDAQIRPDSLTYSAGRARRSACATDEVERVLARRPSGTRVLAGMALGALPGMLLAVGVRQDCSGEDVSPVCGHGEAYARAVGTALAVIGGVAGAIIGGRKKVEREGYQAPMERYLRKHPGPSGETDQPPK